MTFEIDQRIVIPSNGADLQWSMTASSIVLSRSDIEEDAGRSDSHGRSLTFRELGNLNGVGSLVCTN